MKTLCGFWKAKSQTTGKMYLKSYTKTEVVIPANSRVMIFVNDRKSKESDPDYRLVISEDEAIPLPQNDSSEPFAVVPVQE